MSGRVLSGGLRRGSAISKNSLSQQPISVETVLTWTAVWPDCFGCFLRSGWQAFRNVGGFASHLFEVSPGPPGPARLQKTAKVIRPDSIQVPNLRGGRGVFTKPYQFMLFGAMGVTKSYESICHQTLNLSSLGPWMSPNPMHYKWFGAMYVIKPCKFILFETASKRKASREEAAGGSFV